MCGQESRKPWELHKSSFFWGVGSWAGCVLASKAIDLDRDRIRKLRGETVPEFVRNSKGRVDFELRTCIRKKARRARGLGSDPGLDLAISHSSNSLGWSKIVNDFSTIVTV